MVNATKEKKEGKIKTLKILFKTGCKEDMELYERLLRFSDNSKKNKYEKKIDPKTLMKRSIVLIDENFIVDLQGQMRTKEDCLQIWTDGWNMKNDTNLTSIEFAVEEMRKLKDKDIKALEGIVAMSGMNTGMPQQEFIVN